MFGYNYSRPGKGVNKRNPNQSRISIFFELLFRKLWDLCKANLTYILLSIPTLIVTMIVVGIVSSRITNAAMPIVAQMLGLASVDTTNAELMQYVVRIDTSLRIMLAFLFMVFLGQGPITAGFTYILRNYAREEHAWFFSDWWQHAKSNFLQALMVWIIDLVALCIFTVSIDVYAGFSGIAVYFVGIVVVVCAIYLMMHFYIYQLMITFENSLKNIYRNAFILTMQKLPQNLLMLIVLLAIHIGIPIAGFMLGWKASRLSIFFGAEVFILAAVSGFMTNFFVYPQLEKYINESDSGTEDENNELRLQ